MKDKTFIMPDQYEVLECLNTVSADTRLSSFYLFISQHKGEKTGVGLVNMFVFGIARYCGAFDANIRVELYDMIPDWINSFVDDQEVVNDALAYLKEALQKRK